MSRLMTYTGTRKDKCAENELDEAHDLRAQEESANACENPLHGLRDVLEELMNGDHFCCDIGY